MMNYLITLLFIFLVNPSSGQAQSKTIKIALSEDFKPWSWEKGAKVKGLAVDILTEVLQNKMGYKVEFEGFPWSRAQQLAFRNKFDGICTAPSKERLEYLIETWPPVYTSQIKIYSRKEKKITDKVATIKNLDDLNSSSLIINSYNGTGWVKDNIRAERLDIGGTLQSNVTKVLEGRGDVIIENTMVMRQVIAERKLSNLIYESKAVFGELTMKLLINKKSTFTTEIPTFEKKLSEFINDKKYFEILKKYGDRRSLE